MSASRGHPVWGSRTLWAACCFPIFFLALLSLAGRWGFQRPWPGDWTLGHWASLVGGRTPLAASFGLSCLISTTVSLITTPLGYLAAKWMAYRPSRDRWLLLAFGPYAFSPVILATCIAFFYLKLGLAGSVAGVIAAQSMFAVAFATVFFVPYWSPRMKALEELVYTLGGSPGQAFSRALWPVSKTALLICFFQTFLISWSQYGLTLLIGSGKVQTLPILVYAFVNEANPAIAAVASCLLLLPPMILVWLNKRFVFNRDGIRV